MEGLPSDRGYAGWRPRLVHGFERGADGSVRDVYHARPDRLSWTGRSRRRRSAAGRVIGGVVDGRLRRGETGAEVSGRCFARQSSHSGALVKRPTKRAARTRAAKRTGFSATARRVGRTMFSRWPSEGEGRWRGGRHCGSIAAQRISLLDSNRLISPAFGCYLGTRMSTSEFPGGPRLGNTGTQHVRETIRVLCASALGRESAGANCNWRSGSYPKTAGNR